MINHNMTFFCELCDREFKDAHMYSQDLHIRRYHSDKIIGDAVKQYTRIVFDDLK